MSRGPERQLQTAIVQMARLAGWRLVHQRPVKDHNGRWLTAIEGHAGFPDLNLVRRGRLLYIELKGDGRYLEPEQREWRDELERCPGVEYYVLRPKDWRSGLVDQILLRGPVPDGPRV